MLELCLVIILMIRKLLRMSTFFLRLLALSKMQILVHRLLMRFTCFLIAPMMIVDEIVKPSKSVKFSCVDYGYMDVPSESSEFLVII